MSAEETRILVEARDAKTGASIELRPEDIELSVGDKQVDVLTIGASRSAWQALIYFDPVFGSRRGLASMARDLAHEAGRLAALGRVEVQVASEVWLGPTRDPQLVHAALNQVADHLSSLPLAAFERPTSGLARPAWLEKAAGGLSRRTAGRSVSSRSRREKPSRRSSCRRPRRIGHECKGSRHRRD